MFPGPFQLTTHALSISNTRLKIHEATWLRIRASRIKLAGDTYLVALLCWLMANAKITSITVTVAAYSDWLQVYMAYMQEW